MKQYNFTLAFLDIMLCRDGENVVTTVYRKVTNADVILPGICLPLIVENEEI